ncbi:MAG: D-alanine--D-alanine ligase [Bauldia sp.]|nr:D-alanine--D-alanine ligase [Bauldia sp.]
MHRRRVAFLFGGRSEEHDVSVKSAMEVAAALDSAKVEPVFVGITKAGAWKLCDGPSPTWEAGNCRPAVLSPDAETRGLLVEDGGAWRAIRLDAVFPVLHGRGGEDGAIQGLLELASIPYVGCDIQASVLAMDKSLAYIVAGHAGIPTPAFVVLNGAAAPPRDLACPVFVKPARSGSSFGVTKVERPDQLDAAIAEARRYDAKVLIEQAVPGIEVGCAVMGNGADLNVGEVDQITLSHGIFRIHQEARPEQGSENAVITVPAELPDAKRGEIRAVAKSIYVALGCRGLARVDMFLEPGGRIVLNEVNTLPGFTSYSRYPRMMEAAGIGLPELVDRLIALAVGR